MEKVSLYIAGKKADLDEQSFILFNYTMEDLSNPTIVKNSFSKQITLKGTPANNEIFGNLYRSDRKTIYGDGQTGISYDPMRKTPFSIYSDMGDLIESGYVKVDSMEKTFGGYEYKITLYGGLGSFLYGLTYDEEGNKRNLSTFHFKHHDGRIKAIDSVRINKSVLQDAWSYLENSDAYWETHPDAIWDIINFAPCYNGIPTDFDADKVLVNGIFYQFYQTYSADGETCTVKNGCSSALVKLGKAHTEWEVRNIRPYLQRPVLSIAAFIQGICLSANNNGYKVELDEEFFNNNNPIYRYGWITMPMIPTLNRNSADALQAMLKGSLSPCDYLVSLAKMYGLLILCDSVNNIKILSRDRFFRNSIVDISDRIDVDSIKIYPHNADSKWYQLGGGKVVGEFAKQYEQTFGRKYAIQKINTGYEFNAETKELTKDLSLIEAAEVVENNYLYAIYYQSRVTASTQLFPFPLYEDVKLQLFKNGGEAQDFDVKIGSPLRLLFADRVGGSSVFHYNDWLPKVQFHEANNKEADGANCILFFNGTRSIPEMANASGYRSDEYVYFISDDHPDTEELNSGKACWNLDENLVQECRSLPSFRRVFLESDTLKEDLGWGVPFERGVRDFEQDNDNPATIYHNRWKAYLSDRYDVDTKRLTCKVNLSGMMVGQALMRDFYWFDNALWSLNKISNHSITTEDLTECEFIKVKDIKNYTQGQIL